MFPEPAELVVRPDIADSFNRTTEMMQAAREAAQEQIRLDTMSKYATIEATAQLIDINVKVDTINDGLNKEREERKAADERNKSYTDEQNGKVNKLAMAALIISFLTLLATVFAAWFAFEALGLPSYIQSGYSEPQAQATEHEQNDVEN